MFRYLKFLSVFIFNFAMSGGISFMFFQFITKDTSRTGTGAIGTMFESLIATVLLFIVIFVFVGYGVFKLVGL